MHSVGGPGDLAYMQSREHRHSGGVRRLPNSDDEHEYKRGHKRDNEWGCLRDELDIYSEDDDLDTLRYRIGSLRSHGDSNLR